MLVPLRGCKKLEAGIEPVAVRGPVTTDGSVLSSAASFQVPPMFQELPLAVDDPSDTGRALPTARLPVSIEVDNEIGRAHV